MSRWNRMRRSQFGLHREQPKAHRRQETVKLHLEALEDRTLLSVSTGNPLAFFSASSSPAAVVAAVESTMRSTLEQWIATVQQEAIGFWEAFGQEIIQRESFAEQQWEHFLDFNPNAQNSSPITPVPQQSSGSASGSGSNIGHSPPPGVIPHALSPSSGMTPKASPLDVAPPLEGVHLSSSSYTVDENSGSAAVQIMLLSASNTPISVVLTTSDGTATSGTDYTSVDTTVTFQPNQTSETVYIPILDDGASDDSAGSESFSVQLSNVSGTQIYGPQSATITIQENPLPNVYLSSSSYSVNEAGGSVPVEVDLNAASSNPVSVQLTTSNGTATSGIDYTSVNTTVDFQPGQTSQTVTIPILDDGSSDDAAGSEWFSVQLSNPSGAVVSPPSSAVVTIQENSSPPPPPPPLGPIHGIVWQDNYGDGIMQTGDFGIGGLPVDLTVTPPNSGASMLSTMTDSNGDYQFSNFPYGSGYKYQVDVDLYSTNLHLYTLYKPTLEDASSTGIVSDIDEHGYSPEFTLSPAGVEIDAGLVPLQQFAGDTLVWNPTNGDNASTVTNWYDQTQQRQLVNGDAGPGANTPILFDAKPGDAPNSNAPIIWDKSLTVASISLNQYTGQQTINPGIQVESNGVNGTSLSMDGNSGLNMTFSSNTSKFQIDNNATITTMNLSGDPGGQFTIFGGTTYSNPGSNKYKETVGVTFTVASGGTLYHPGPQPLIFTDNNLALTVTGQMVVTDINESAVLIQQDQVSTGCYINVDGGALQWYGFTGLTNTIAVPVLVQGGGRFLAGGGSYNSGTLIVQGAVPQTHGDSVYLTGTYSSVQLRQQATLECDNDYYQDSGTLETTDATACVLQDGQKRNGTAIITSGGILSIDYPDTGGAYGYGELDVKCGTLRATNKKSHL